MVFLHKQLGITWIEFQYLLYIFEFRLGALDTGIKTRESILQFGVIFTNFNSDSFDSTCHLPHLLYTNEKYPINQT